MVRRPTYPLVIKLAKDLQLPIRGNPVESIQGFALDRVARVVSESPVPVRNLDELRVVVANKFRVRLEFIETDDDISRISHKHADFHPHLLSCLREEFTCMSTEGITLERDVWDPRRFRFLAVIDARGERAARAFFTAWHEIAHLVVHPDQIPFPGFRRTPAIRTKDPLESVVDQVAARIGFFPPLFAPTIEEAIRQNGGFTFGALETARAAANPQPSVFATALASLHFAPHPVLFISAERALRKADERKLHSPQVSLDFAPPLTMRDVRAVVVAANDNGRERFEIRQNMRIPEQSVIYAAHESIEDAELSASEDQSWWETSRYGQLPSLPLDVQAVRRGRFVYGLLKA